VFPQVEIPDEVLDGFFDVTENINETAMMIIKIYKYQYIIIRVFPDVGVLLFFGYLLLIVRDVI